MILLVAIFRGRSHLRLVLVRRIGNCTAGVEGAVQIIRRGRLVVRFAKIERVLKLLPGRLGLRNRHARQLLLVRINCRSRVLLQQCIVTDHAIQRRRRTRLKRLEVGIGDRRGFGSGKRGKRLLCIARSRVHRSLLGGGIGQRISLRLAEYCLRNKRANIVWIELQHAISRIDGLRRIKLVVRQHQCDQRIQPRVRAGRLGICGEIGLDRRGLRLWAGLRDRAVVRRVFCIRHLARGTCARSRCWSSRCWSSLCRSSLCSSSLCSSAGRQTRCDDGTRQERS